MCRLASGAELGSPRAALGCAEPHRGGPRRARTKGSYFGAQYRQIAKTARPQQGRSRRRLVAQLEQLGFQVALTPSQDPAAYSGHETTGLKPGPTANRRFIHARRCASHEVVIDLIGATTTRTGLQVHAELDPVIFETNVKIGDEQMAAIALDRHKFLGEWNCPLHPEPRH